MTERLNIGELDPKQVLQIAEKHICRALGTSEDHIRKLEEEDGDDLPALSKALADARKAVQVFFDERTRFDKYSGDIADGGGGLDLDEARNEIWRRLSCLRDARRKGGVLEGPSG